jgi:ubiquinone/menaquinone biosynthesis C-methylase UbiE
MGGKIIKDYLVISIMAEFDGVRAKLYKESIKEFPEARLEDIAIMKKYLHPKKGEVILEVGAGSGFFSGIISDLIGEDGKLIVSDPSSDQLEEVKSLSKNNIEVLNRGAEDIDLEKDSIDSIWSFGAIHHCFKKEQALSAFHDVLKTGGKVVVGDVFSGSKLAEHFDEKVDKYCITGHNVEFWTDKMVEEYCKNAGFEDVTITELDINWKFKTKEDIGIFLYKIHGMTKTTPEECLKGAEEILGIEYKNELYCLNWPMKIFVAKK